MQFDLRNGSLRKKFDALKYTLKKLEVSQHVMRQGHGRAGGAGVRIGARALQRCTTGARSRAHCPAGAPSQDTLYDLSRMEAGLRTKPEDIPEPEAGGGGNDDD